MPTGKTKVATKYLGKYKEMNPNAVEGKDYYIEDKANSSGTGSTKQMAKNISAGSKTGTKKTGGTLSYKGAYDKAGGADKLGDYAAWEKKAKAYNTKKYGTTEPTAKANKMTGGSKTKLASEHTASQAKVERIEPRPAAPIATETKSNNRLQQAIASANAPESLMSGTKTRRETRRQRQDDRVANRRQRQDDRVENRQQRQSDRQQQRQSPLTKSGRPKFGADRKKFQKAASMASISTGLTDKSGNPLSKRPSDKVISAMGSALSTSATPKAEAKKKKTGGEFWGKSGPIK